MLSDIGWPLLLIPVRTCQRTRTTPEARYVNGLIGTDTEASNPEVKIENTLRYRF